MKQKKIYPSEKIIVKEEFSPFVKIEKTNEGHHTHISIPNKYDIQLTVYDLMPGISAVIDHSNLYDYIKNSYDIIFYEQPEDTLLVNFLVKGQCQYEIETNKYMFIKENYVNIYIKELNPQTFSYIGDVSMIHLIINRKQFKEQVTKYNKEYEQIIEELFEEVKKDKCIILKSPPRISDIIEDAYKYPIQKELSLKALFRLKALECLVVLYEEGINDEKNELRTYTDAQIRVVRYIKFSLSRNIASYVSLDGLSKSYGINLTTLKNCFKDMYGKPLYTWYKEYKFHRAKELIENTTYPISKIAYMIGYKSSSKFAKAFKKEMGVLPSSYRKNKK